MVYHDFSTTVSNKLINFYSFILSGKFDNNFMMTDIKIDLRVEKLDQSSEDLFILQKTVS